MHTTRITRALISVSDKSGIGEFARRLAAAGVEIVSTGGTRRHLESEGVSAVELSEYTGFPEMMDGRLKTLHPKVFGGILCRRDREEDMQAIAEHGISPFELVVVNLYPFEATIARDGATEDEAIEQIDIGGPSLVRAAAKNHAHVTVATDVGTQVHPDNIRAQVEGAALWGLSLAMYEKATLKNGGIEQTNFDSYTPLRMSQVPEVAVSVIANGEKATGVGEPAVTVIAPALGNAIFNAVGARVRSLPITPEVVWRWMAGRP